MNSHPNLSGVIEQVKELSACLTPAEKEQLRDELLAFFLFSEFNKGNSSRECDKKVSMVSLTDEERMLIKKLADQTEALFKANRNNNDNLQFP